jgi:hypothetical protein
LLLVRSLSLAFQPNAERHLAKAGGSKGKLRGIPTLVTERGGVERAKWSGGLHKRSAEDWGSGLRARGGWPPSWSEGRRCGQEQARSGGWWMTAKPAGTREETSSLWIGLKKKMLFRRLDRWSLVWPKFEWPRWAEETLGTDIEMYTSIVYESILKKRRSYF